MAKRGKILAIRTGSEKVKKNYKKIMGYALVMVVSVLIIVLVAALSENKLDEYQLEYEESMTISQKQIATLEEKIKKLEKENSDLEKRIEAGMNFGSDLVTGQQAFLDMKEVYEIYKSGDVKGAKLKFSKIETMGFDDILLGYHEILSEVLSN